MQQRLHFFVQIQKGKGMNKFLKVGLFSATFLCISATQAAPLEDAMKSLAKNSKAFEKAQTVELAQTALDGMAKATQLAKQNKPKKLKNLAETDVKIIAYEAQFNLLLNEIQHAQKLVQENKLDEAKQVSSKFDEIKKQGHKAYRF